MDWRTTALALGWPAKDLDALASVLSRSQMPQRVVRVTGTWIEIESDVTYIFDGVAPDGEAKTREFKGIRTWRWNYYAPAEVRIEPQHQDDRVWCIAHAYECRPDAGGCGLRDLIRIETCDCGAEHVSSCEVWRNAMLEPAVVDALEDKPITEWKPPVDEHEKPKRSNGWSLPGQLRLT